MDAEAIIALINATTQVVATTAPLLVANDKAQVAAALAQLQALSDSMHAEAGQVGEQPA